MLFSTVGNPRIRKLIKFFESAWTVWQFTQLQKREITLRGGVEVSEK